MDHNTTDTKPYPRYWLITAARTASNMLVTMLNLEEQNVALLRHGGYFFFPSVFKRFPLLFGKGPIDLWTDQERAEVDALSQEIFDRIQDHIEASEKSGKTIFVKEHALFMNDPRIESDFLHRNSASRSKSNGDKSAQTSRHEDLSVLSWRGSSHGTRSKHNLTVFPDEFLHTITPTFLIRHPAMMIPSYYRTALDQVKLGTIVRPDSMAGGPSEIEASIHWNRALYDFYTEYFAAIGHEPPMVLDADDIMISGNTLVPQYASLVGLDPSKIRLNWEKGAVDDGKLAPIERRMLSTLLETSGVDRSKIAGENIDIDAEAAKWREEFGEDGGKRLEQWVRAAMPHYEHMRAGRMRPGGV
ncbi:uncharacterized protein B0I36DRAFT_376539 [Microdochium trichocladiopsis]|uniref:P-loop containing nucleoside triphosphate hydrolase protein n=1 Tax=Microdochium trichocladiopsis TaxID=1682393 RepID=A0A9P8XWQ4_9PEZI|nr:uncharacterized protein B0I36DRAFT_376539 [Microdochium trichocladiopsis]KAH7024644.1 hypothetical protein B0I36DRAFT_376539 [Microdochium trichocladiopsis]